MTRRRDGHADGRPPVRQGDTADAAYVGAVHTGTVHTGAVHTGAVHTGGDHTDTAQDRLIQSRDNPLYKRVARLLQDGAAAAREKRRGNPSVVLEGIHLCQMWLEHAGQPAQALFDAQALERHAEIAGLHARLLPERCALLAPALAASLSQVVNGPGVYFLAQPPQPPLPDRIDQAALWLDRVQDPGNVGTLLRTAAAAGIRTAFLSQGCASAWSGKALRAGQGAQFAMTLHHDADLARLRAQADIPLVATALHDAVPLYDADLPAACLWVFGNEGQGVSADLLHSADLRVFIPQSDAVESLNVAAAAAICLFEQRRQALAR